MNDDDVAFERDLIDVTEGGFFNGRRFGYPPLEEHYTTDPNADRALKESDSIIQSMLEEDRESRVSRTTLDQFHKEEQDYAKQIRLRQAAYAGWLVMQADFRHDRDIVQKQYSTIVAKRGFPNYPRSMVGESAFGTEAARDELLSFVRFLQKWGLETLATWDLPVPMGIEAGQILYEVASHKPMTEVQNAVSLNNAGLVLFVPWPALRDQFFTIKMLARHAWRADPPEHVSDWLRIHDIVDTNWGLERYDSILRLHRYYSLALRPRYEGRSEWAMAKVDVAFADFLGLTDESVRKLRQRLERQQRGIRKKK